VSGGRQRLSVGIALESAPKKSLAWLWGYVPDVQQRAAQHGRRRAERNSLEAWLPDAKLLLSVGMVFATARDERDGGHDGLEGDVCHD